MSSSTPDTPNTSYGDSDSSNYTPILHDAAHVLEKETSESSSEELKPQVDIPESEVPELVDAFKPIMNSDADAVFRVQIAFMKYVNTIRTFHLEYILLGMLIAIYLPALAWLALAYVFALPTLLCLQHFDWLLLLRKKYFMLLPIVLIGIITSDVYAMYCLTRVFQRTCTF
jgi:hypothetical protein